MFSMCLAFYAMTFAVYYIAFDLKKKKSTYSTFNLKFKLECIKNILNKLMNDNIYNVVWFRFCLKVGWVTGYAVLGVFTVS